MLRLGLQRGALRLMARSNRAVLGISRRDTFPTVGRKLCCQEQTWTDCCLLKDQEIFELARNFKCFYCNKTNRAKKRTQRKKSSAALGKSFCGNVPLLFFSSLMEMEIPTVQQRKVPERLIGCQEVLPSCSRNLGICSPVSRLF